MVTLKITNNDPIGLYVSSVYTECPKNDRVLIEQQDMANKAIKHFAGMPANRENCEALQNYIKFYHATCVHRPDSDAKTELLNALTNIIDTLQTGIDREPARAPEGTRELTPLQRWLESSYNRWKMRDLSRRKPITDQNTLEGFIRNIPNITSMGFHEMMDKYGTTLVTKFFKTTEDDLKDDESVYKFVDRCTFKIADIYVLVMLTSTKPTYTVIENQYPEAEELYEFVVDQGMSEPATAGAR